MTPSSDALIGVPSGTARLMPSFCKPFGFGPKAWMTRPRTGQRKPGPSPASAVFAVVSGAGAVGAATRALSGDSRLARFWLARFGPPDCVIAGCVRGGGDIGADIVDAD